MPAVQITGTAQPTLVAAPIVRVDVRASWTADWVEAPYLQPTVATLAASPSVSSAQFLYRYGTIRREDGVDFAHYGPLHLANHYVRITAYLGATWQVIWMGVIQDTQFSVFGGETAAGDESLTAYGFEHLLDRAAVEGALTDDGEIGWCPPFNERPGWGAGLLGNKSATAARFSTDGDLWSNADIIDYLVTRYAPSAIPWSYSGLTGALADLYGVYSLEGLTLKQCLDKLIDRRRGLGWTIRYGTGAPVIHVFSILDTAAAVGDVIMPANSEQITIDVRYGILIGDVVLATSQAAAYDSVLVQGSRAKVAFTSSVASGSLETAWSLSAEAAYKAAGGGEAAERDAVRTGTQFESVYQHFRLPDGWSWTDYAGVDATVAFDDLAQFDTQHTGPRWNNRRPFLRYLPIPDPVNDGEMLRPLAFLEVDGTPYQADRLGQLGKPACSVSLLDGCPGISLSAGINHVLAAGHLDAETDMSATAPVYDYGTLVATVAIETDARPAVRVAVSALAADFARTLVLDVPDAHYWYVVPGTVIGCENGTYSRHAGGVTRDDTAKLRQIAAMAAAWYGRQRASLRFNEKLISPQYAPGMLVTDVTSGTGIAPVGTVITQVSFDFQKFTTSVSTAFGELDFAVVLDIPGMSDFRSVGRAFNRLADDVREVKRHLGRMPVREAPGAVAPTTDEDAPGAVVDWWCDDFDRANSADLGALWRNKELCSIDGGDAINNFLNTNPYYPAYQFRPINVPVFNKRFSPGGLIVIGGTIDKSSQVQAARTIYEGPHSYAVYDVARFAITLGVSFDGFSLSKFLAIGVYVLATDNGVGFQTKGFHIHALTEVSVSDPVSYNFGGVDTIFGYSVEEKPLGTVIEQLSPFNKYGAYMSDSAIADASSYMNDELLPFHFHIYDVGLEFFIKNNIVLTIPQIPFSGSSNAYYGVGVTTMFQPLTIFGGSAARLSNVFARNSDVPDVLPVGAGYGRWNADDGFTVLG